MKKLLLITAMALTAVPAFAADMGMPIKAPKLVAPASPWDFAFGTALMSDYNFRGVTQSNHKPSVAGYFEPRYNVNDWLQLYAGVSGESISFPNRAAAEIDAYTGFRPTIGKLALDFGFWYYWYPGGSCFNNLAFTGADCVADGALPINGNVVKKDLSFYEGYAKATYNFFDYLSAGASVFYSPSVLNSGANGTYVAGNVKYTFPTFLPNGIGMFLSGDVGHWFLGTSDNFYCTQNAAGNACGGVFPGGIPYKSYTTWDVGLAFTYKVFTLDFRYYDTNLSKGDCNAFTSAQNASGNTSVTPINPGGAGTNWCGSSFIVKFSADLTAAMNLK